MVVDFIDYVETKLAQEQAIVDTLHAAQKAETVVRANLEWILADLLADIQAA